MFEVRDRGRKQLDFGIQAPQRKVIRRKLGVQSEVYVRSLAASACALARASSTVRRTRPRNPAPN